MPDVDEERPIVGKYPSNVDGGINLMDIVTVKTINLVFGILISGAVFGPIYLIFSGFFEGENKLTFAAICIILFAVLAILIAIGRNGDPLTVYVLHMINYSKTKRVSLYNPRVKKELKSLETLSESQAMALKAGMLANQLKKMSEKKTMANFSDELDIPDEFVFDDDIRVIEAKRKEELERQKELNKKKKAEGGKKDGKEKKKKRRKAGKKSGRR